MSTDRHNPFTVADAINISSVNARMSDLDAAIPTAVDINIALSQERQATTVDGGGSSATTWNQRGNLTEVVDADSIVTLSTNTFTPVAGTYMIWVDAVANEVGDNRIRLYNVGAGAAVQEGLNCEAVASGSSSVASLFYIFTATGTQAYRIEHYTELAKATDGLGAAVGDGSNEVYCQIMLAKLS